VTICTLRSLWRVATILALPEKSILDLRVNLVKPLLGTLSLLSVCFNLGFEFCNTILSISKLLRKPLRHIHGVSAILLSNIGGFVQKLESDRLCRVECCCRLGRLEPTVQIELPLGSL